MSFKSTLLSSLAALGLLAGCGGSATPPVFDGGQLDTHQDGEEVYPGPYGTGTGSIIKNFKFMGYARANVSMDQMIELSMADFYNPTGTENYPEGSAYGVGQKPKAIVLDRSAVWCPPCNQEAATHIPEARAQYAPQGEFFLMLGESATPGNPATPSDLKAWSTKYKLNYPGSIDPRGDINAIVGVDAWPGNVIVRTKDMRIVHWMAGAPVKGSVEGDKFWQIFEDVLADKPVLPSDQQP